MKNKNNKKRDRSSHHKKTGYKKNHWESKKMDGKIQESKNIFEGIISITRRGVGYVDIGKEEDVEIHRENLNCALDGDVVGVVLLPKVKNERTKGEVTKIVTPGKRKFVGVVDKTKTAIFVKPDNRKMYVDILIPFKEASNIKNKEKVLVEIVRWDDPLKSPEGKVLEIIGQSGVHEVEIQSILRDRGIDWDFPKNILDEALKVADNARKEIKNYTPDKTDRRDFRNVTTFTIDPDDAKDFDDALSIRKLETGNQQSEKYEIGVHIADVSHYVKEGNEMDKEARERGFSVYLVDRTVPMLPEYISNDIASLVPNEDRFTFSAVFTINKDANVEDVWFGKTVIHSDKRFSYEEAQDVLDSKKGPYYDELSTLMDLSLKLRKEKVDKGAIEFHQDEIKFELDKNGKPIAIHKKKSLGTNSLIEEFMLLANKHAAHMIEKQSKGKFPFIYRVHDEPNPDKIAHLGIFLEACGYDFDTKGPVTSKDIQDLLKKVSGTEIENLIEATALRTMAKAVYSTKNIGHFGLAFSHYTHFTSPIRRYPDLLVHRLIMKFLNKEPLPQTTLSYYKQLAKEASDKELEVVDAERASIRFKQVEYMSERIGEIFDARVVGIMEYGIFVEVLETLTEGLVPLSSIPDDYYVYNKGRFELRGEKTGKKFVLGDKLKVKVVSASPEERTITFKTV